MTKAPIRKKAKRKAKARVAKVKPGVAPGRGGAALGTGRQPPFIATDEQRQAVMALVSFGTTHEVIAQVLRIPERTLTRHFREELTTGKMMVHARVGGRIVAEALRGDKTMAIFYAKAQMGWRDGYRIGFEDKDRNPVNPSNLFTVEIT